jgi:transcriptional regulator with XRE-family HTH domain
MSTTIQLIDALKRELKAKGVTYAELAQRLGISEASVKRTFALRHFSLERLERVLAAVGMDFMELAQAATDAPHLITQLTLAQEQEIIGDKRLLVVAVAALNLIPLEHIVATYRLLVARTFSWIPNGPIQTYFRAEAFSDFLDSEFNGQQELLQLVSVMLRRSACSTGCSTAPPRLRAAGAVPAICFIRIVGVVLERQFQGQRQAAEQRA